MNRCKRILTGILAAVLLLPAAGGFALPKVFFRGDGGKPQLAITRDDCRKTKYAEQMLDVCQEYGFHMTFSPAVPAWERKARVPWAGDGIRDAGA